MNSASHVRMITNRWREFKTHRTTETIRLAATIHPVISIMQTRIQREPGFDRSHPTQKEDWENKSVHPLDDRDASGSVLSYSRNEINYEGYYHGGNGYQP